MLLQYTMNYEQLDQAVETVQKKWPGAKPVCGLILGSGWSAVVEAFHVKETVGYPEIPGLGKTGVPGHAGRLVWAEASGLETFIFQGRRHWYKGEGWTPIALPVYLVKQSGASALMLTNAAGASGPICIPVI